MLTMRKTDDERPPNGANPRLVEVGRHVHVITTVRVVTLLSVLLLFVCELWLWASVHSTEFLPLAASQPQAITEERKFIQHEVFMERLDRLLPLDSDRRLSLGEISAIESELLQFQIPSNITVLVNPSEYISIQFWRWLFADQHGSNGQRRCPRCKIHFKPWADGQEHINLSRERSKMFLRNKLQPNETADVILDLGCPRHLSSGVSRAIVNCSSQVLIGGCGESPKGSGSPYFKEGRNHFDFNAGFFDMGDGSPFQTTYAHLHLSPDDKFGFQELWNVTDVARQMLSRPERLRDANRSKRHNRTSKYSAVFIHNNCGGMSGRGGLVKAAIEQAYGTKIARYGKCFHNAEPPEWLAKYDGPPCSKRAKEFFFHGDCEATRDGTKTVLSGLHDFTFALENTLSHDYFTEKRWEALLAGSVPIVWDNHNSLDSLPDPDSALLIRTSDGKSLPEKAQQLTARLQYYQQNRTAYQEFFQWKERGLSHRFLRKLFLSNDYLICRICEFVAQRKARGVEADSCGPD